jgi:hypothetical protein
MQRKLFSTVLILLFITSCSNEKINLPENIHYTKINSLPGFSTVTKMEQRSEEFQKFNLPKDQELYKIMVKNEKGGEFLTRISFEDGFKTEASSGSPARKANEVAKIDAYLVELAVAPAAGSDPLASISASVQNLAKSGSNPIFNLLFSNVPTNNTGKQYFVGIVAKDSSGTVISKPPNVSWSNNALSLAPTLSVTSTGATVNSSFLVSPGSDLSLTIQLTDLSGAITDASVLINNGLPVPDTITATSP